MSLLKEYQVKDGGTVTVEFEGQAVTVPAGISVAAAVLSHGHMDHTRKSPISGENRAPYCFMGVCHECLVEIDGIASQQGCIIEVREGMRIRRQLELPGGDER